jgi:hypothetical protein
MTETTLAITENEIYSYGVDFQMSGPVTYSLWICPVNRLESLEGLAEGSSITLTGRRGTRLIKK